MKGMSLTRRNKFFRHRIPLTNTNDMIVNTGHVAADTVAHCGDNIGGSFAWSITLTDRLTAERKTGASPKKQQVLVKNQKIRPSGRCRLF